MASATVSESLRMLLPDDFRDLQGYDDVQQLLKPDAVHARPRPSQETHEDDGRIAGRPWKQHLRLIFLRALLALAALSLLLLLFGCSAPAPGFKATDITGGSIGGGFALPDHNGKIRQLEEFRGKLVVVFFGFTHCPDVCPTTLSTLSGAMNKLGPDADKVQVIMITVDPARDTQKLMAQYVPSFNSRFLGLVPSEEALKQVADKFKVVYVRNKPTVKDGFYTVDHTAASYVLDRQGRTRLYVRHEASSDDWAADLRLLLSEDA